MPIGVAPNPCPVLLMAMTEDLAEAKIPAEARINHTTGGLQDITTNSICIHYG